MLTNILNIAPVRLARFFYLGCPPPPLIFDGLVITQKCVEAGASIPFAFPGRSRARGGQAWERAVNGALLGSRASRPPILTLFNWRAETPAGRQELLGLEIFSGNPGDRNHRLIFCCASDAVQRKRPSSHRPSWVWIPAFAGMTRRGGGLCWHPSVQACV